MKLRRRCKCGCGSITNPGRKYIQGHNGKKHGLCNHKLYVVWKNMISRCYNTSDKRYQDWGGRDIRVFIGWRFNIKSFYNWAMAHGWKEGLEIDREDNNGNYHPENCRFVTRQKNCSNRRMRSDNTSGYPGVFLNKIRNKYQAYPTINSKRISLGHFDTVKEAAETIEKYKNEKTEEKI